MTATPEPPREAEPLLPGREFAAAVAIVMARPWPACLEAVKLVEARDAAIRAQQARADAEIARECVIAADGPIGNDQIADEILRRAGLAPTEGT